MKNKLILIVIIFLFSYCTEPAQNIKKSIINTTHLDFLYEDIIIEGNEIGIIHIYSNAPEYDWIGDDDEGIACLDDAARAAQFYMKYFLVCKDTIYLKKAKNLLKFIIHLQADNGYFYNFIWPDYSINKTFKTSVAEPNWWTWRAVATLADGYKIFKNIDVEFAGQILQKLNKTLSVLKSILPMEKQKKNYDGFELPSWLPAEIAADQAAVLSAGFLSYLEVIQDSLIREYVLNLCEGMKLMQVKNVSNEVDFAFLSWKNIWHAYGNLQSFALIKYGILFQDDDMVNSALDEIDNFYLSQIKRKFTSYFRLEYSNDEIIISDFNYFPQIAYNIRPMVYACLSAYNATSDPRYAVMAGQIAAWLVGNNIPGIVMYDKNTGRGYDGINSETEVNMNSGAESTIEALLTIVAIEGNEIANIEFRKYLINSQNK